MTTRALTDPRLRALNPEASVWVAASAGSGKTQLLSDRVIRLMIGGSAPSRILCLTFTRAAAAEMAQRINTILARYAVETDQKLEKALADLLGRPASETERLRARRLFAQVLDVPGGLRIMTIHAFCQSLLRRFPIEADLAPHFEVLDEAGQSELIADAALRLFAESDATRAAGLGAAWRRLAPLLDEERFYALNQTLRLHRAQLAGLRAGEHGLEGVIAALHARLRVPDGADEDRVMVEASVEGAFDRDGLGRAAELLERQGGKTDKRHAALIRQWLTLPDVAARALGFDAYARVYLTGAGPPREKLASSAVASAAPGVMDILGREQRRVRDATQRRLRAILVGNTAALLRLEARFAELYAREKARAAALDFDDQIDRARALLEEKSAGAWVLYKLDGGLEHILVDEAQDTAPAQWRVVEALVEEFYAGLGAREVTRTLFAVGDEKQSIFSFQGADLAALEAVRSRLTRRAREAKRRFDDVPLARSFRSTGPVLALVDAVFADEAVRAGVARAGEPIAHTLVREGQAGLVELWPVIEPVDAEPIEPRAAPVEQSTFDDPERRFAHYLAHRIERWLRPRSAAEHNEALLPSRARPMRAGDILLLVRHRTGFGPALIAALKSRDIPVAGVDRLALTEQLAVMDLMALGDALLLPQDDLNFACLLKSPLIGFDEERLFALAHGRGDVSLWQALTMRRAEHPDFARAHDWFAMLLAKADFVPPFELFAGLLARGGRAALLRRLGPEASDAIDEFLARALDHERTHPPSLQGFLHWLRSGQSEVKRDGEPARDEVRVMTVHGAKGLQAPVVIMADTVAPPRHHIDLLWTDGTNGEPALPLFPGAADFLDDEIGAAALDERRRQESEERRRLLYVALTRAEDRLYVGGYKGPKAIPEGAWYQLIAAGFERLPGVTRFRMTAPGGPQGEGLRFEAAQTAREPDRVKAEAVPAGATPALPEWALRPPPPEAAPRRHVAASERYRPSLAVPSALDISSRTARRRGRLIHRLLELLPALAPAERGGAIEHYLARRSLGLAPGERREIAARVMGVLDSAEMTALLGPDSLAEVPLSAEIDGVLLSGQIDRLAITPDRILVIDYKTGGQVPERPEDAPPAYRAQLAAYRAILATLYPDRPIACGLLYTDRPVLHWLQESVLAPFAP